jgi:hypothetical protein
MVPKIFWVRLSGQGSRQDVNRSRPMALILMGDWCSKRQAALQSKETAGAVKER